MKTKTLLSILTMAFIVSAFGQRPSMELTFTVENSGQYIPIDSIFIENITQGGDTTLYAPDTVLVLDYLSGIGDNMSMPHAICDVIEEPLVFAARLKTPCD